MKCKYCGKKGVKLSHFPKAHKALMARKSAAGRRKAVKGSQTHEKAPGKRSGRRRSSSTSERSPMALDGPAGFVVETVTYRRA